MLCDWESATTECELPPFLRRRDRIKLGHGSGPYDRPRRTLRGRLADQSVSLPQSWYQLWHT